MAWFAENLFTKWFTQYHKTEDSYKDLQGRGLLERYVKTIGQEIDTNILPYLENLQDNILQPKSIFAKLLPFREQELGVNLVYDDTVERRKQILAYWLRLVQIKGTKRGYEVCIRLMNFNGLIIDTVDVVTYFSNPLPSAGCNACYEYDVIVKGNKEIIDLTIVDAFFNLIEWNEPINCKLRYFIYNDTYVPKKLVKFFFKGFDDEKLYVDIKRNPLFKAKLDNLSGGVPLDNQGNLLIEDEFAEFYQYDSELWQNQGFMLYSQPTPDAYLPFDSLPVTDVTQTTAQINWSAETNAVHYILNLGLNLLEYGNEIVANKIIDNINVGNVTSYDLTNLLPNTPYYAQIKAVRADNKQALSKPQAFITMVNVTAPIALPATQQNTLNFVANWQAIAGINGYEVQVSDTNNFTNILNTTVVIGNLNKVLVELPNNINCFYRVRAYKNRNGRLPILKSYSDWSNIILISASFGNGLRFDGVSDYVLVGNPPILQLNTGSYCVIFRTNYTNFGNFVSSYKGILVKKQSIGIFVRYGKLTLYNWFDGQDIDTGVVVNDGQIYNVVLTFENIVAGPANNVKCYVNGNLVVTTTIREFYNTYDLLIGWGNDVEQYFEGDIYDVKIFDKILSQSEAESLNNSKNNVIPTNNIANWNFNQKQGNVLLDTSGNGLNGNLINFANTNLGVGNSWIDENGNSILL